MIRHFLFLSILFGYGIFSSASLPAAENADRPNILFIFTDDQSHRSVSCYPEAWDWVKTPNIDALASRGIRFANATIGTWCMASRLSLLTGHHPYGVESMRMVGTYPAATYDPEKCPFWPSVFRKNGYQTAQIGKWHTGIDNGFGRDWDYQLVWNRPAFPENAGAYYYDQIIQKNGAKGELVKGYSTDNYTNWALDYLRGQKGRKSEKPWYLWLCYSAVHGPFTPAERHLQSYPGTSVPVPDDIYPPRKGKPTYSAERNQWVAGPDGAPIMRSGEFAGRTVEGTKGIHGDTLNDLVRQYHQGVLAIDEGVGKLITALKETGQYDNTLIVFAADQGMAWGQHGFQHKLAPYDANTRGPLIVSMPSRFPEGKVCDTPVGGVDLVPTFFSTAGLDLPWNMHGNDLTPLLEKPETAQWEHSNLTVLTGATYGSDCNTVPPMEKDEIYQSDGIPWWISLRSKHFKYIRTLMPGEPEELYDLNSDPEELKNLATDPVFSKALNHFRGAAIAELRRTDCPFVDGLPPVKGN